MVILPVLHVPCGIIQIYYLKNSLSPRSLLRRVCDRRLTDSEWCPSSPFVSLLNVLVFPILSRGMEAVTRFAALDCQDLPFFEYARKFCVLAAAIALEDPLSIRCSSELTIIAHGPPTHHWTVGGRGFPGLGSVRAWARTAHHHMRLTQACRPPLTPAQSTLHASPSKVPWSTCASRAPLDFNIYVDNEKDALGSAFIDILNSIGVRQHVSGPLIFEIIL